MRTLQAWSFDHSNSKVIPFIPSIPDLSNVSKARAPRPAHPRLVLADHGSGLEVLVHVARNLMPSVWRCARRLPDSDHLDMIHALISTND